MMFTTVLKEISVYYDRRFLTSTLLPVLLFLGVMFGFGYELIFYESVADLLSRMTETQIIIFITGFILSSLGIAWFVVAFQTTLMRFFEGYWAEGWLFSRIKQWRIRHYQKKWQELRQRITDLEDELSKATSELDDLEKKLEKMSSMIEVEATPEQERMVKQFLKEIEEKSNQCERLQTTMLSLSKYRYSLFPPNISSLMPTRLGNVMRAAEYYPAQRYQMDAVILWPRLLQVLPPTALESLRDSKATVDLMMVVSAFSALFSITSAIGILIFLPIRWGFFGYVGSGFLLSYAAYLAAVQAALSFGEQIKSSFDLYRWDLLKKLNLEMPATYEEERQIWEQVTGLIFRMYPPDHRFYRYSPIKNLPAAPPPRAKDND